MNAIKLKLYVVGKPAQTRAQVQRLRETLDARYADRYDLELCDVLQRAADALEDHIYVTPTLVRKWPRPEARLFGDLSSRQRILSWLDSELPSTTG